MGTMLECTLCRSMCDSNDGYLRPEGFLCGRCYAARCGDPAYVAEMERQLMGLVSAIAIATAPGGDAASSQSGSILVPTSAKDRLAYESLVGLSIGDALGAQWEGQPLDTSRLEGLNPSSGEIAPWTDDTQMALSIVEVLISARTVDQDRLAGAFGRRYEAWRGYGAGMHVVLPELRDGKGWRELGERVFRGGSFGNGSAMRVAPLGAYFYDATADVVVREAERSAEVTHAHPEGKAGAAATAI